MAPRNNRIRVRILDIVLESDPDAEPQDYFRTILREKLGLDHNNFSNLMIAMLEEGLLVRGPNSGRLSTVLATDEGVDFYRENRQMLEADAADEESNHRNGASAKATTKSRYKVSERFLPPDPSFDSPEGMTLGLVRRSGGHASFPMLTRILGRLYGLTEDQVQDALAELASGNKPFVIKCEVETTDGGQLTWWRHLPTHHLVGA